MKSKSLTHNEHGERTVETFDCARMRAKGVVETFACVRFRARTMMRAIMHEACLLLAANAVVSQCFYMASEFA